MFTTVLGIIFLILVVAVLIWGADGLLKLLPGNERLKQAARIIAIVVIALYALYLIAGLLGVPMPWGPGYVPVRRYR